MTMCGSRRGFSLLELIIAIAIVVAVVGAIFKLLDPSRGLFEAERERTDVQQRIRMSTESLFRDLVMAGAGSQQPGVAPFRRGQVAPDPAGAAYTDRISVAYVPRDATSQNAVTATYWIRVDGAGVSQLMRYDGRQTDLPVADHITRLQLEYFSAGNVPLPHQMFTDGPWLSDAAAGSFDADLLAVRRVRVMLRVRVAREILQTPWSERETRVDVAPRNLNLE